MPHVSKYKLKTAEEEKLKQTLGLVLRKINKDEEMEGFLYSLLSETEKIMLAKRLAIMILITEGLSEAEIADKLNVTRETVLRIQMLMQIRGNGYEIALKKLEEEKYLGEFKKFLLSLGKYSLSATSGYINPRLK